MIRPGRSAARAAHVFAIIGIVAGALSSGTPARAAEMRQANVGRPFVIRLKVNPSTGYQWRVDRRASSGLNKIVIKELGTTPSRSRDGRKRVGAPTYQRWQIRPRAAGRVRLEMVYRRPWESKPAAKHRVFDIHIK